ncbi:MAG: hypothetical protein ACYDD1_06025 [Caulobacteraceae bacterium]
MAYASDPSPGPSEIPQPADPDLTPAPDTAPFPEISPGQSPSEAPQTPAFPDNGRPYDLA